MSTTTTNTNANMTTNTDVNTAAASEAILPGQARGESPSALAAEARVAALLDAGAILPVAPPTGTTPTR